MKKFNTDSISVFDKERISKFQVPNGCTLVHSTEDAGNISSYSFVTRFGVINTYELNETGGYDVVSITFADGYRIDVNELLKDR